MSTETREGLTQEQLNFLKSRIDQDGKRVGRVGPKNKRDPYYKTWLSLYQLGYVETGFRIEGFPVVYLTDKGYSVIADLVEKHFGKGE